MVRIGLIVIIIPLVIHINQGSPLDAYVGHWDFTCTWKVLQTYPSPTYTVYILNMTSQTWLNGMIPTKPLLINMNNFS